MKKILVMLAVILAAYPVFGQDMEEEKEKEPVADKKFTIQTNPLLPFIGIFEGENERLFAINLESQFKISGRSNIGVELSFLYNRRESSYYDYTTQYFQINLRPIFILRPFNTGIKGFYLGFYPHFGLLRTQERDEAALYGEVGFGLDVGYKWVSRNGFTVQLGNGIGKTYGIPKRPNECGLLNSDGRITFGTTDLRLLDLKLGYSW